MHIPLVIVGIFIILLIVVHIIFRVVKFTFMFFLLGIAFVSVVYVFQHYFGIDLIKEIGKLM